MPTVQTAKQPYNYCLAAAPDDVNTKGSCNALHGHIIQGGAHTPTGDDRLTQDKDSNMWLRRSLILPAYSAQHAATHTVHLRIALPFSC